jgi:hypothetical protein
MRRIYLDVDGVLLGDSGGNAVLARHASAFIEYILDRFDVYWLTTHCQGDADAVLTYLTPYTPPDLIRKLEAVRPTRFQVMKTEALAGDFYWLEDSPLAIEVSDLQRRGLGDRWIEVNTRLRRDDLLFAMKELQAICRQS